MYNYQETAASTEQTEESHEIQIVNQAEKNRWNLTLDEAELDLVNRIVMLEAGGESDLGQQAVAEVIFNRVYSPFFPNTVYEVLSQNYNNVPQFTSWKNRNSQNATPSLRVIENVEAVLDGMTNILPYETLYFSQKGENKYVQITIGNHVFCNQ